MNQYIIKELQNEQSHRNGSIIMAKTLTEAKKTAQREREFTNTILVIEHASGWRMATKVKGMWHDGSTD